MTDIVTGTPAIVGFTQGHHGHHHNPGWNTKDELFASTLDLKNQGIVESNLLVGRTHDVLVAVERTGRSAELATEKIGAASILESSKNAAATQVLVQKTSSDTNLNMAMQHSDSQLIATQNAAAAALAAATNTATILAAQAACCCELKALILSTDAQRVRDSLQLLQTQFMILTNGAITPATAAALK
jgi:hypothetical protein